MATDYLTLSSSLQAVRSRLATTIFIVSAALEIVPSPRKKTPLKLGRTLTSKREAVVAPPPLFSDSESFLLLRRRKEDFLARRRKITCERAIIPRNQLGNDVFHPPGLGYTGFHPLVKTFFRAVSPPRDCAIIRRQSRLFKRQPPLGGAVICIVGLYPFPLSRHRSLWIT